MYSGWSLPVARVRVNYFPRIPFRMFVIRVMEPETSRFSRPCQIEIFFVKIVGPPDLGVKFGDFSNGLGLEGCR